MSMFSINRISPLLLDTKTVTFHGEVIGTDAAAWIAAGWDPDDALVLVS